jgi:NAD(P)-dependent dehydrogenase (short-subunit alcohol dehydrogenase family)
LCSYLSVKEFAKRCEALPRIDAVVENAGISTTKFEFTEGAEKTITTNGYSTFLLALLLLPKLKETATQYNSRPHLVIFSSDVHFLTSLPERKTRGNILHELSDKGPARMRERYFVSKLLEVFACREICATNAPQGYPVIINYLKEAWPCKALDHSA